MYFLDARAVVLAGVTMSISKAFVCVPVLAPRVQPSFNSATIKTEGRSARTHRPDSTRSSTPARTIRRHERNEHGRRRGLRLAAEDTPSGMPGLPGLPSLPGVKTVVETEEEEEARAKREWQDDGRKGRILIRRNEIPMPEQSPAEACRIVFQSLQNNDDPMLDYGAAVAIKFASSLNAVSKMTPADYGAFLRNDTEYSLLLDNSSCRPTAKAKPSPDGKQMLQSIELTGIYPEVTKRTAEVQLSQEDGCWKIDAISFMPL